VASELKITKAALHYHFASKSELGEALVTRYATRFAVKSGRVVYGDHHANRWSFS
jgi:TetR/AcrR family transcriptional repressor of nem operon